MSLVAHKYTPAEIPEPEFEATFAARGHTVDYLLKALRDQTDAGTLSSYVVLGPRGSGKSTVLRMVELRMRKDAALRAAWLPVVFPEEQFEVTSLRDLLAATLENLAGQGIAGAAGFLERVAGETDDEQSLQLAITGLRTVARQQGKRLVLFLENLNLLLEEAFSDQEKGTLRRLLMADPFMMVIGSAVHVFDALRRYDEAFFNYFAPVRLPRLTAEQVFELLTRRAEFDGNERFKQAFPQNRPRIRAIVQLSGGNPRLVLMLYELLSQRQVTTIVAQLRRLVDELTPLLKDEIEWLPPQQRKIIHALMEKGGTAQPADLVGSTRLPLGTITKQLGRLREAQFVELGGGGKGRRASYTVPDQLFVIWYQMRYLRKNRRRIELFVEALRVWFEADERAAVLREMAATEDAAAPGLRLENAWVAEYYAVSLKGTPHESTARDLAVAQWLRSGDLHEAALVQAELSAGAVRETGPGETPDYLGLGQWCLTHDDLPNALAAADRAVAATTADGPDRARALAVRGYLHGLRREDAAAIADCTAVVEMPGAPVDQVAKALFNRGVAKGQTGDAAGEIADCTAAIDLPGAPVEVVAWALRNRGVAKRQTGDTAGEIADCTAVIDLAGAPVEVVAWALRNRGITKGQMGDATGEIADCTAVIDLAGAPVDQVAWAFLFRGVRKGEAGDSSGEMSDYTAVIELAGAPFDQVTWALLFRGIAKGQTGDTAGEIADCTAVIGMPGAPDDQMARALVNRGIAKVQAGDAAGAIEDCTAALETEGASVGTKARAILFRADLQASLRRFDLALADLDQGVALGGCPAGIVAGAFRRVLSARPGQSGDGFVDEVIALFAKWLARLPEAGQVEPAVELMRGLATPEASSVWVRAWRRLAEHLSAPTREALQAFDGVAAVLEDGDRSVLEPLPPEQREFAETVLKRFEPAPTTEAKPK